MPDDFEIEIGVLNITIQPHPDGIYVAQLKKIANKHVNFYDQDWAAISEPERLEGGYHGGQVWIWTELDPDAPAVNKEKLEEVTLEEANIHLPPEFGINGRTFNYILREKDHRIFYEWKNDLGHYLAPKRLCRIFDKLFFKTNTDGQFEVTITVQNEEDALDKILKLPILKTFEVHLVPPNPDENEKETERVLKGLEDEAAKARHARLEKKSGRKTLKPSDKTLADARVAAAGNGHVTATGTNDKRQRVKLSTADYPKKLVQRFLDRVGAMGALLRVTKDTTIGRRR